MKIAIIGAGGVGGYFGERLAQTGALVRMGRALDVSTPTHEFIYASLLPMELKARGK